MLNKESASEKYNMLPKAEVFYNILDVFSLFFQDENSHDLIINKQFSPNIE